MKATCALRRRFQVIRNRSKTSLRDAAKEIGVSAATLHRLEAGRGVSWEHGFVIQKWCDQQEPWKEKPLCNHRTTVKFCVSYGEEWPS